MAISSHLPVPSRPTSPSQMPRRPEIQRPYSPFRMGSLNQNGCLQKVASPLQLYNHSFKAFLIPRSTPSSSRSPSVASWASFDTDYDDGLIIEEIDSDDENQSNEVLVGEYEDPPSDDEYWERRKSSMHNTPIDGFDELSTSNSSSPCEFVVSPRSERPPTSPTPSKRTYWESASNGDDVDTDREGYGRRTKRRLLPRSLLKQASQSRPQITREFNVSEVHIDMED